MEFILNPFFDHITVTDVWRTETDEVCIFAGSFPCRQAMDEVVESHVISVSSVEVLTKLGYRLFSGPDLYHSGNGAREMAIRITNRTTTTAVDVVLRWRVPMFVDDRDHAVPVASSITLSKNS